MPYILKPIGHGYKVFNIKTNKYYSKNPLPYQRALAQMRILIINEKPSIKH